MAVYSPLFLFALACFTLMIASRFKPGLAFFLLTPTSSKAFVSCLGAGLLTLIIMGIIQVPALAGQMLLAKTAAPDERQQATAQTTHALETASAINNTPTINTKKTQKESLDLFNELWTLRNDKPFQQSVFKGYKKAAIDWHPASKPQAITTPTKETPTFSAHKILANYNALAPKRKLPLAETQPFRTDSGEFYLVHFKLSKDSLITFFYYDDKTSDSIGAIASIRGDGTETEDSGTTMILTVANIVQAVAPDMSTETLKDTMGDLGFHHGEMMDGKERWSEYNNILFTLALNPKNGIMLYVGPATQ